MSIDSVDLVIKEPIGRLGGGGGEGGKVPSRLNLFLTSQYIVGKSLESPIPSFP